MVLKLGLDYQGVKICKVNLNDELDLTFTYFTARLNVIEWCSLCFRLIVR